jgi:hypothetical protein
MRLPRVRFTIRRMMVVVAVTAIAFGGAAGLARVDRLASEYRRLYAWHSAEAQRFSDEARRAIVLRNARDQYVRASRLADYHAPPGSEVSARRPQSLAPSRAGPAGAAMNSFGRKECSILHG